MLNVFKVNSKGIKTTLVCIGDKNIMKASSIFIPQKTSENLCFSGVYRGYRNGRGLHNNYEPCRFCVFLINFRYIHHIRLFFLLLTLYDTKMKFSVKDLFSKCDQIRRKLRIWSHLLKKCFIEKF